MTTDARTAVPHDTAPPVRSTGPLGRVVVVSIATGALLAAAAAFLVLPSADEARVVGGVLLGFAAGWALLLVLSRWLTTGPQHWTAVPAGTLGVTGGALLATDPGEGFLALAAWVWAPLLVALAVWVARRAHRLLGTRRSVPVIAATVAMAVAGTGGLFAAASGPVDDAAGRAPGRLVDVGGYRLHLSCAGTGSPTVVLLNGLGESSPDWARVVPTVEARTRVCSYDRAGQGWSDASDRPADTAQAVADLHVLLDRAGERGPFVLAGHSSGGVHALAYAHRFPAEVAGLVLVDSASPWQVELVPSFTGEYEVMRRGLAVAPTLFRLGAGPLLSALSVPDLPAGAGRQSAAFANSARGMTVMRAEQLALPESFRQAQVVTSVGDLPLVVLTSAVTAEDKPGWGVAQDRLAALSSATRHTVEDLDHAAFLHDPAGARVTSDAITGVVVAARDGRPVPSS